MKSPFIEKTISYLSIAAIILGTVTIPSKTAKAAGGIAINTFNFPDILFREIINNEFDKDHDHYLSTNEIGKIKEYSYSGETGEFSNNYANPTYYKGKIKDLKGIEFFTELKMLSVTDCSLIKLDLTKNKKLEDIFCDNNKITNIKLPSQKINILSCEGNKLDNLDISQANVEFLPFDPEIPSFKNLTIRSGQKVDITPLSYEGPDEFNIKIKNKKIATSPDGLSIKGKMEGSTTFTVDFYGAKASAGITVLFKDVTNPSKFWYEPTYYLSKKNIVKGYDNQTKFKPDNDCTRAQMVTFLWRLAGSPKPKSTSTKFKDVKKSAYYYKPVLWAVEKGITTGVSKTKFNPSGVCTRAQTVTFLWRMAGKPKVSGTKNPFKDIKKSDYFYQPVLWAAGKGIVEGYKDKTFRPKGKCLRRQMVTFLYRYEMSKNSGTNTKTKVTVTDRYRRSLQLHSSLTYTCAVPKVSITNVDTKELNDEIYLWCEDAVKDFKNAAPGNDGYHFINYRYFIGKDFISIVMQEEWHYEFWDMDIYVINIDTKDGHIMSRKESLSKFKLTDKKFTSDVAAQMKSFGENNKDVFYDYSQFADANNRRAKDAMPYYNSKGHLGFIGIFEHPAGSGYGWFEGDMKDRTTRVVRPN